jgi:hypothetical protein
MKVVCFIFFLVFFNLELFGQDSLKRSFVIQECVDTVGDVVIMNPDTPSMYVGGGAALWSYVKKNLLIPKDPKFYASKTILNVLLNIDSTGMVSKVVATDWETDEWKELGRNVVKTFKNMPKWIPRTSYSKSSHYKDYQVVVIMTQYGKLSMRFNDKVYH